jgi:hypothetical protein
VYHDFRAPEGQCFRQPRLGLSECVAHFAPASDADSRGRIDQQIHCRKMLFDFRRDYLPDTGPELDRLPTPVFFDAALVGGRLAVPPELYRQTHERPLTGGSK